MYIVQFLSTPLLCETRGLQELCFDGTCPGGRTAMYIVKFLSAPMLGRTQGSVGCFWTAHAPEGVLLCTWSISPPRRLVKPPRRFPCCTKNQPKENHMAGTNRGRAIPLYVAATDSRQLPRCSCRGATIVWERCCFFCKRTKTRGLRGIFEVLKCFCLFHFSFIVFRSPLLCGASFSGAGWNDTRPPPNTHEEKVGTRTPSRAKHQYSNP